MRIVLCAPSRSSDLATPECTRRISNRPGNAILLGVKPNRVDLLTGISGVTFEEAWAARTKGELEGIPTQFIGREELLRNKRSTGRAKDMGDAEELRKRPIA